MFGSQPRNRRPLLLVLVYGAFLVLVGVTATAQAVMVSLHFSAGTLNSVVASDSAAVRAVLDDSVELRHLDPARGPSPRERAALDRQLGLLVRAGEILRVELRGVDGSVVAVTEPALLSRSVAAGEVASVATTGQASAVILPAIDGAGDPNQPASPALLREFVPLLVDGQVRGVIAVWRDAEPILTRLDVVRRDVVAVTLSAAVIASAILYLIFRAAQGRLSRQTVALVEATRRDPLTDTLNHGALVGHLAAEIERARSTGTPLGVALLDIDNFRLLNDNHGHRAGDEALLAVTNLLRRELPGTVVMGRYGPDEFLLIAGADAVVELEPVVERLRAALVDLSLQFDSTERLPVTISAGLCIYPQHGSSVTVLLAVAARTLEEAKASGGDAIRLATHGEEEASASGFDVLQGLVHAVDTKDRYTKRHSEDVARYAVFLAERLGLDPEQIRSIQLAGLLHDVGKIGIPDPILRKPGKLTEAEYEIVKQHVALGDMIVRDVPDIAVVRAGIRHHHERWDGDGYLDRLAGEGIPLIARILAVGDAFSAMTTTRPYRKALGIREALVRLEDAAGSQLDERLVLAFITGIEGAADPPLPGSDGRSSLWTPSRQVA